jgi:uncharacterized YccA/Bax inhibitor family protein
MRTSNPTLSTFDKFHTLEATGSDAMTINGTALKTAVLLVLAAAAAGVTWTQTVAAIAANQAPPMSLVWGGAIAGLILAIATTFKPNWAPFSAPLYAIAQGLFLGAISALYNNLFAGQGIVFQAICLTFGTLFAMLIAYQSGWIRATEKFKLGIVAATGGIMLVYLIGWVMSMFGSGIPFIHESGLIGIGFSLFVVVIAALNLVLDFDMIEQSAARGEPKFMEWYGAFALMVTLVWLYLEILRLLSKLQSRD